MATLVYYLVHAPEEVGRLALAWPPARTSAVTRGTRLCEKLERGRFRFNQCGMMLDGEGHSSL